METSCIYPLEKTPTRTMLASHPCVFHTAAPLCTQIEDRPHNQPEDFVGQVDTEDTERNPTGQETDTFNDDRILT